MSGAPVVSDLRGRLDGAAHLPNSAGYERATSPRNSTVDQQPAAVAAVRSAAEGEALLTAHARVIADALLHDQPAAAGEPAPRGRSTPGPPRRDPAGPAVNSIELGAVTGTASWSGPARC